ncbi:MAG: hypothetical protein Q9207_003157 [Kuettlingeria erythrocarpa]
MGIIPVRGTGRITAPLRAINGTPYEKRLQRYFKTKEHPRYAFAAKLERTLQQTVETLPSLADALYHNIESIGLVSASAAATTSRDLDDRGTTIWNLTSKHKENGSLCDILALNRKQPGVTEQIIERAAFYERRIQRISALDDSATGLVATSRRLRNEYHILRIASEWRRGRLDLADIWLTRLGHESIVLDAEVVEHLADTLFEIGRDQAKRQQFKSALTWLERAHSVFSVHGQENLGTDASALKSSLRHCFVHTLLKERCEENKRKAWNIIRELENEGENTVAVSMLKLQVLTSDFSTAQDYFDVLVQVVRQIHLSDSNLRTILHHIHELKRRDARLTHTALVSLISERLLAMEEIPWIEKTVITLIWNCATSLDLAEMTDQLEALLNKVASVPNSAFSASATHAAQLVCVLPRNTCSALVSLSNYTLIYTQLMIRRIETAYSHGDYDQADSWCRLALHGIFGKSGESNIGKLQRYYS